jgi:hypothetical protein
MKVYVLTYDRYDTTTTSAMLEADGVEHTVLCHTEEARQRFIEGGRVRADRIVATGEPKGIANQRNWILEHTPRDEWVLEFVDDLRRVTEVAGYDQRHGRLGIDFANQTQFKDQMHVPIGLDKFVVRAEQTAEACERVGARLGGFCYIPNPVWRDSKWRFNVMIDGRCQVMKKGALRFDPNVHAIDDMAFTIANIRAYGIVVLNQWVVPDCARYSPKSLGSIEARLAQKRAECAYLVERYPQLVRFAPKVNHPPRSHVRLRPTLRPAELRELARVAEGVVLADPEAHPGVERGEVRLDQP